MNRLIILGVLAGSALTAGCAALGTPVGVAELGSGLPAPALWTPEEVAARVSAKPGETPEAVRARLAAGDAHVAERRWAAAREEYLAAAGLLRADGTFAGPALRRLANSYYFQGRHLEAAAVLDTLAAEAALFGELSAEAEALFGAALLYNRSGRPAEARERVIRLQRLLTSPFLPETLKDQLVPRLVVR
ncbi:MAG TPA: hypothetical protein VIL13_11065 [Longimicrobiales bacterium]